MSKEIIKKPLQPFENAVEKHKKYPDSFEIPTFQDLLTLHKGSFVKICTAEERFWVKILSIEGNTITARVNNDLICTGAHGLYYGDVVEFTTEHIYATFLD